jgi:hypothetical protein
VTGVTSSVLSGLPGASDDPGNGPVVDTLVDGLLGDVVPVAAATGPTGVAGVVGGDAVARPAVAEAVAAHRDHRASWYGDLLGPMRVPASSVADVVAALVPRDHALPVMLVAPSVPGALLDPRADPLAELHAARALLLDDRRIEVVGVELPLPGGLEPAAAARRALAALDVSVPAWFVVPPDVRWLPALDVLAEDGAESVALHVVAGGAEGSGVAGAAAVLRRAVDLDVAVAATSGELPVVTEDSGCGLLNLLCAVRAALNGASPEEVTAVLACRRPEPLCSAARRMSDADAAVVRAFLPVVTTPSVREAVAELESLSLIAPDAA